MPVQPALWGSEKLVNTTTAGAQELSEVTALRGGGYVVTWRNAGAGISGQIFDGLGVPSGNEFVVSAAASQSIVSAPVVPLADGGFVCVFTDLLAGTTNAKIFDAGGSQVGNTIEVGTSNFGVGVTALDTGGFAFVWGKFDVDNSNTYGVALQLFDGNGVKAGKTIAANTTTQGAQYIPVITALGNGKFVVAWQDDSHAAGDTSGSAIRFQIFDDAGTAVGTEKVANTSTTNDQKQPAIVATGNGTFVIAWTDLSNVYDASGGASVAQMFDASGNKIGSEFLIGDTGSLDEGIPSVTRTQEGGLLSTWTSLFGDILARSFSVDGNSTPKTVGNSVPVNSTTAASQYDSAVTTLADGRIVVTWNDLSATGSDTDGSAIRMQILDPRGGQITGTDNAETIAGSNGGAIINDSIQGLGGDDLIYGLGGNDGIDGGAGKDTMYGGAGDDVYVVDSSLDVIVEKKNEGSDFVQCFANYTLSANIENARLASVAAKNLTGNDLANVLDGNDQNNTIAGGGGNDTITANSGNDTVDGGAGNDQISGGEGSDRLTGGIGSDTLTGGAGTDVYFLDAFGDKIVEEFGGGTDYVFSTASHVLEANVERLTITGSAKTNATGNELSNYLKGNGANNSLFGLGGHDRLDGGFGKDVLEGGAGKDQFIFSSKLSINNVDTIKDFDVPQDIIGLDNAVFAALSGAEGTQISSAQFYTGAAAHDASDRIIYNASTGALYYDADGNAAGGVAAIKFAVLVNKAAVTSLDFLIV